MRGGSTAASESRSRLGSGRTLNKGPESETGGGRYREQMHQQDGSRENQEEKRGRWRPAGVNVGTKMAHADKPGSLLTFPRSPL